MRIWTQKSASIQKRTSPLKFDNFAEKSEKDMVSYLSTKVQRRGLAALPRRGLLRAARALAAAALEPRLASPPRRRAALGRSGSGPRS